MNWRTNLRNPKNLGVIRGPHGHGSQPHLSVHAKGGRIGKFGGGRTNLLEQLGRVEAERSNPNRRAEISRVHGELNRGYKTGGRVGLKKGGSDKNWIQKATKGMVKTKPCTGKKFGSNSCPPGSKRYNLAKTFKKMGQERKAKG